MPNGPGRFERLDLSHGVSPYTGIRSWGGSYSQGPRRNCREARTSLVFRVPRVVE